MLAPDHFRDLYLKLPQTVANEIASPFALLNLASDQRWQRTYFEKKDTALAVYLLDSDNRVLRQLQIEAALFNRLADKNKPAAGRLAERPQFARRLYPARLFFEVLASQSEDIRNGVIPQPALLLQKPGHITQVGISDEAVSEFIALGFEFETADGPQVVRTEGHRWAVMLLRSTLETHTAPIPAANSITETESVP